MTVRCVLMVGLLWSFGCGEPLPPDISDYASRCLRLNDEEEPPHPPDDPHDGYKTIYACEAPTIGADGRLTYPDGAIVVKESRKPEHDYPFLVATARKHEGRWSWAEYTRNFPDEAFLKLPIAESVCVDCHREAEANDWIITPHPAPLSHDSSE